MKFVSLILITLFMFSCSSIKLHHTSEKYSKPFESKKKVLVLYSNKILLQENVADGLTDDFNIKDKNSKIIGDSVNAYINRKLPFWLKKIEREHNISAETKKLTFNTSELEEVSENIKVAKNESKSLTLYMPKDFKQYIEQYKNDYDAIFYIGYNTYMELTKVSFNGINSSSQTDIYFDMHYSIFDLKTDDTIQKGWGQEKASANFYVSIKDIDDLMIKTLDDTFSNSPFNKKFTYKK